VDAAVAVGFALAVVYPEAGNIGGGGFMLIRPGSKAMAHGEPQFLDYREKAPAAASANMYLDAKGNVVPKMSTVGSKASGVPGTVAGLTYAEQHYGKLGLKAVMQPAIRLASEGYVLSEEEARLMHSPLLTQFPLSHHIFQRDGNFYKPGERFLQPELARTLLRIAANPEDFYKGKMAAEIAAFEKAHDGLITAQDLASYECKERTPLLGHYHGLDVLTSPPPSSGGIVLLEILNILSGYDPVSYTHLAGPLLQTAYNRWIGSRFRLRCGAADLAIFDALRVFGDGYRFLACDGADVPDPLARTACCGGGYADFTAAGEFSRPPCMGQLLSSDTQRSAEDVFSISGTRRSRRCTDVHLRAIARRDCGAAGRRSALPRQPECG